MDIDPEIFKEFENKLRLQEALGETPLAKNPFFIRTMSDPVFTGNGTEGVEPGKKCTLNQTKLGDGYKFTILHILSNFRYGFSFQILVATHVDLLALLIAQMILLSNVLEAE